MAKSSVTGSPSKTARPSEMSRYAKGSRKLSSAIFISEKKHSKTNPGPKHARY